MKVGGKKDFLKIYNPMQKIENMSRTFLCRPKRDLSVSSCKFYSPAKDVIVGVEDDGHIIVKGSIRGYLTLNKTEFNRMFNIIG